MIKKLFTLILLLGVALTSWGTIYPTPATPDGTGKLTLKYVNDVNGFVCEDGTTDLSAVQTAFAGKVTDLTLEGDYTNADWASTMDAFVAACAPSNGTINLDMSKCTSIVSKVDMLSDILNVSFRSPNYNYYYSNDTQPENVTKSTIWVDEDGKEFNGTPQEEVLDGKTYYYYQSWYGDGIQITEDWKISQYNNGQLPGANGSWNNAHDTYTYYEWWNSEDQHGPSHVITISKKYVTQQDIWKKANGTVVDASLVTVDPSDDTKGTIEAPVAGTAFAFSNCKSVLKSVAFPNSDNFLAIPDYLCSVENCPNLENIDIENTKIQWIGEYAFGSTTNVYTSKLKNVTFPTSLKVIGMDAFKNCVKFTKVDLSSLSNLVRVDAAAFNMGDDAQNNLTEALLPSGSTLKFFGNQVFSASHIETLDFSKCTGIVNFAYGGKNEFGEGVYTNGQVSSLATFYWHQYLKTLILPPTLENVCPGTEVSENNSMIKFCGSLETVQFTGTDANNDLVLGPCALAYNTSLKNVVFSPNLVKISTYAFAQDDDFKDVNLSGCHRLTLIETAAFVDCQGIEKVYVCSHKKVIKAEAFRNVKSIKRVEVVGCPNTDMTECICENRAFELDVTHHQTATLGAIEKCALLVFPEDGTVSGDYTSAFDYFVGDYKAGVLISQEALLAYYRNVPKDGRADNVKSVVYNEETGQNQDVFSTVECMYQKGNGWHEFLNVGRGEVVTKGEFLRTYSRTAGDGPCVLPQSITAYRAIDYKSTKVGYVYDKKNGNYYCKDESIPEADRKDTDYVLITVDTPESDYAGKRLYSKLTIGGKLLLKPLWAKVADAGQHKGYAENKEFFDDKMVNDPGYLTSANKSYVPEKTGVVLYSTRIAEDAFLMLPTYDEDDLVLTEYGHTEGRFEEDRKSTDPDNINMLQGSYGTGWPVAPVEPWNYANEATCSGGSYGPVKEYRDFACVLTGTTTENGKEVKTYGWRRLTPSKLKVNRAYAKIPISRFNNHNESVDQMPDFTLEDHITEGTGSANLMLLSIFEDMTQGAGETDGIRTVNTTVSNTDSDAWYTLQGVKVEKPAKGVYIHNNKKVVIK